MLARYWMAPIGLFVLQVAPVGVKVDSTGRFRLAFGAALGSYQETSTDCEGNVLERQNFKFRTVGGEVEAYVAPKVRVAAHAGSMSTTPDPGNQIEAPYEGFFGGAMVAYEGEKTGTGIGLARVPRGDDPALGTSPGRLVPMVHFRVGRLGGTHGFFESGSPSSPGGPPEVFLMGIGYGWGQRRQVGVRASLGRALFPSQGEPSFNLVVRLPVAKALDLGLAGAYRNPNGGNIGVFGRVNWGQPPR